MKNIAFKEQLEIFFKEDDIGRNYFYNFSLPREIVQCELKIKSECVLAGLPFFVECFEFLGCDIENKDNILKNEGKYFESEKDQVITFNLPFHIAIAGERVSLNILQHLSSIATYVSQFVKKANSFGIQILDTRKTLPGYRSLEKYAVRMGGGKNHRFGQTDLWMIKDNHKSFFGGIKKSVDFFNKMGTFYNQMEVEIHDIQELEEAISLNVKHLMLDNFTPSDIRKAVSLKPPSVTYEVSGGITERNIEEYLIKGVDAISIGKITYGAPPIDLSLKIGRNI